jgi:hypothetical protein
MAPTPKESAQPVSGRTVLASLTVLIVSGLVLRLHDLGNLHMYYDELAVWVNLHQGPAPPHDGPLLAWLLLAWSSLLHESEPLVLRMFLVVLATFVIPAAYALGTLVRGRFTGLLAALLTTFSPLAWTYAGHIRPYGLYMFLSTGLLAAFVLAHRRDRKRDWALYGALLVACACTHLITVQIGMGIGLYSATLVVWAHRKKLPMRPVLLRFARFCAVSFACGVLGVSWWLMRNPSFSFVEGAYPDGVGLFVQDTLLTLGPSVTYPNALNMPGLLRALVFAGIAGAGALRLVREGRSWALALVAVMLCTLVVHYFSLGQKGHWPWARYITHLLVPYLVLVASGLEWLGDRFAAKSGPRGRFAAMAALGCVTSMLFLPGWSLQSKKLESPRQGREFPAWAKALRDNETALAGVVVLPHSLAKTKPDLRVLFGYYYYKTDRLPVYKLVSRELFAVDLQTSPTDGRDVPAIAATAKLPPPGVYALIGRRLPRDCDALVGVVHGVVQAKTQSRGDLLLCHLVFGPTTKPRGSRPRARTASRSTRRRAGAGSRGSGESGGGRGRRRGSPGGVPGRGPGRPGDRRRGCRARSGRRRGPARARAPGAAPRRPPRSARACAAGAPC